jgi:Skp family chaperone for outer membrane proteins
MKLGHKSALAALVILGILGLTTLSRGQAGGVAPAASNPPPTKLAVVNVVELFDNLLEKTAADTDIDTMKRGFEKQNLDMQKVIEDKQKGLASYKAGTEEYRRAQEELLQKASELQTFGNYAQQRLLLELSIRTKDIYRKILDSVAKYSAANGIALVFVADNPNMDNARSQDELKSMVSLRKILYFHPDFDITSKIKQMMNTEYELGKKP